MKKLFFALPLLLAGCQSARVAYQFQPGGSALYVAPARPAALPLAKANADADAVGAPSRADFYPASSPAHSLPVGRRAPQARFTPRRRAAPVALAEATSSPVAGPPARPALPKPLVRRLVRQHATAGPARTTENGLGGIGLFAIGVVLAVLAGLGALVSLIPGVSFLGGVGLAAAGLVVLFLLYRLLSGGK